MDVPLLIGIAVVGGAVAFQLYGTYRGLQIARGARARRPYGATGRAGLLAPQLGQWHDELRALGFERLGEVGIDLPGESKPHYSWILVDDTRTVEVELVGDERIPPLAGFVSTFGDGGAVQTMFPHGESIRRDDFVSVVERDSLAAAVDLHRREVETFSARHGRPFPVNTMVEHLRHDATFRERHAVAFLMQGLVRGSIKAWLVIGVMAAAVLYLTVVAR